MPAILLIDDNALQLCIRETVLRDAGFSVVTAATAAQALDFLSLSKRAAGRRDRDRSRHARSAWVRVRSNHARDTAPCSRDRHQWPARSRIRVRRPQRDLPPQTVPARRSDSSVVNLSFGHGVACRVASSEYPMRFLLAKLLIPRSKVCHTRHAPCHRLLGCSQRAFRNA